MDITWKQFIDQVNTYLKNNNIDENVEIDYIDFSTISSGVLTISYYKVIKTISIH